MAKIVVVTQTGLLTSVGRTIATFAESKSFDCSVIVISGEDSDTVADTHEALYDAAIAVVLLDGDTYIDRAMKILLMAGASQLMLAVVWVNGTRKVEWPGNTYQVMPMSTKPMTSGVFETWIQTFWGALELLGYPGRFPTKFETSVVSEPLSVLGKPLLSPYRKVKVLKNTVLTAEDYDRPSYCLTLDLTGSNLTYNLGDHLVIYPENSDSKVDEALEIMKLGDGQGIVDVKATGLSTPAVAPSVYTPNPFINQPMRIRDILKYFIDIQGKATRKFVSAVSAKAQDPLEAAQLRTLAFDMKAASPYYQTSSGVFSYISLLQKFKSISITLAELISIVPVMRPRFYSASSSPLKDPNQVECTFVVMKYPTRTGAIFEGLSTTYLSTRQPGDELLVSIRPLAKPLQLDDKIRYIGVALGSGVALLRGISQHFNTMKQKAEESKTGLIPKPMLLFYGVRHEKKDFIFADELMQYEKNGVLTLYKSFSHDTAEFITPATRITENPDALVKSLVDHTEEVYFVYCGPAGPAYKAIETAITGAMKKVRPDADPNAVLQTLKDANRWNIQAFTPNPDPENPFPA